MIFVCMGNICRSPMAEAVLRSQLTEAHMSGTVIVDSAGTGDWHVGDPADRRARAALAERGYPLDHRARQFEPAWFDERDLVVALDRDNVSQLKRMATRREDAADVRLLREFDPSAEGVDVPDPYYGGADGFVEVLDQIELACAGLVQHLSLKVGVPRLPA